jgi:hypothetical protein
MYISIYRLQECIVPFSHKEEVLQRALQFVEDVG